MEITKLTFSSKQNRIEATEEILRQMQDCNDTELLRLLNHVIVFGEAVDERDAELFLAWEKTTRNIVRLLSIRCRKVNAMRYYYAGYFAKEVEDICEKRRLQQDCKAAQGFL